MKVRCLFTSLDEILDARMEGHVREFVKLSEIGLERDGEYTVHGIVFRDEVPWYYLCDSPKASYPVPFCSLFFEVICSVIPADWLRVTHPQPELVPRDWAEFPFFLERLLDEDTTAEALFARLKQTAESA